MDDRGSILGRGAEGTLSLRRHFWALPIFFPVRFWEISQEVKRLGEVE
jgi:hypothetical protein